MGPGKARTARLTLLVAIVTMGVTVPAQSVHDRTPPETYITKGPGARTTDTTPKFRFSASEPANFVCKRDGKAFAPCESPKTLKPLSFGRHGFYVRAIDGFGNRDATAAAYSFKVKRP
jgi:hypothetical protein